MRRLGLLAVVSLLAAAAPADAAITKIHLAITASATRHVTVTETDSPCTGTDGTETGQVTDTATLTTKRTATVVVIPGAAHSIAIEPETDMNNSGEILTHGTLTRSSTLNPQGGVACPGDAPPSCGSKQVNLNVRGGAADGANGRTFRGIAINGGLEDFSDPFPDCRPPAGEQMLPSAIFKTVPFTRAFMVSCRHGRLTHRISKTETSTQPGTEQISSNTTVKLSVTVTRLGPLRGYRC